MASGFTSKLLFLIFVSAGVVAAQSASKDDLYTVVKEVRGTKPTWIVIFSGHLASNHYPSSPRVRYTLQFDRCLDHDLKAFRCDPPPLRVGQSLDQFDVSSTDHLKGTAVSVNDITNEFWLNEVRGDNGLKGGSYIYRIVRTEVEKDASVWVEQFAAEDFKKSDEFFLSLGGQPVVPARPVPRNQSITLRKDIPAIAKAANPAIVTIITTAGDKPIAQGTGFVVSADGVIVTNYHVIKEGNKAIVKFSDGTVLPVDGVLAADKVRDLVIVKIHGKTFRTLTLGDSDRVQVGEEVVAIGNPLGLELTVSNGIVSGLRTDKQAGGKFLQTTAPISPGSSGGPLFNMLGEVVGINTMYLEGGENLNFAIPVNDAKLLLSNQSTKLQNLPNEIKPAAPSEAPATPPDSNAPSWESAVEYMKRMTEPEHHDILPGELTGAQLSKCVGRVITVISHDNIIGVFTTGKTEKNGYPEYTYTLIGEYAEKDYPRYASICLNDIDPSSVEVIEAGLDLDALSEFWDKHPECGKGPGSVDCMLQYLKTGAKLTAVRFHTTDLKLLIEQGGFKSQQTCAESEKTANAGSCGLKPIHTKTVSGAMIFFRNKDRAQRFVTALRFAVKSEGGKSDMFPPTR